MAAWPGSWKTSRCVTGHWLLALAWTATVSLLPSASLKLNVLPVGVSRRRPVVGRSVTGVSV